MPRRDPVNNRRRIRAYHRASAALRDLHREEWEALRTQFLESMDGDSPLYPAGPAKGRKPQVQLYRKATSKDRLEAQRLIDSASPPLGRPIGQRALSKMAKAGFLLMRKVESPTSKPDETKVLPQRPLP